MSVQDKAKTIKKKAPSRSHKTHDDGFEFMIEEARRMGFRDARFLELHDPIEFDRARVQTIQEVADDFMSLCFPVGPYLRDEALLAEVEAEMEYRLRFYGLISWLDAEPRYWTAFRAYLLTTEPLAETEVIQLGARAKHGRLRPQPNKRVLKETSRLLAERNSQA